MASAEYQEDLQSYEDVFSDVLAPLAARGFIRFRTVSQMRSDWERWSRGGGAAQWRVY